MCCRILIPGSTELTYCKALWKDEVAFLNAIYEVLVFQFSVKFQNSLIITYPHSSSIFASKAIIFTNFFLSSFTLSRHFDQPSILQPQNANSTTQVLVSQQLPLNLSNQQLPLKPQYQKPKKQGKTSSSIEKINKPKC